MDMEIWDGERLRDSPEVTELLQGMLRGEPALQELHDIRFEQRTNMGVFFSGAWAASEDPVFVKLNASAIELDWMTEISEHTSNLVPHVYAFGRQLGGNDLGWMVLKRMPYLFDSSSPADCRKLMDAAALFQQEATGRRLTTYPIDERFFETYLPQAIEAACPGPGQVVLSRLHADFEWVTETSPTVQCHGDVHFANAVSGTPDGDLVLIDPIPRTANWAWDAAYAQMTSGMPGTPRLVPLLDQARRDLELPTSEPECLRRLERTLLGWSSMMWWAIIPFRRRDPWWAEQVRSHVTALAMTE